MIKGPKNAIPTLKGWVSPKGELLKAQKITQAQIDEWYSNLQPAPEIEVVVEEVNNLHSHEDEEHSHDGGDVDHHHHDDGTVHDHDDGDEDHTHDDVVVSKDKKGFMSLFKK